MIFNPEAEELLKRMNQLGIHEKTSYSHPTKTGNKSVSMSLGRQFFNVLLPDDFRLIDEPVKKSYLNTIIKEIFQKYGPDKASMYVSTIQKYAFRLASIKPSSFNIDGLVFPKEWVDKKNAFQNSPPDNPDEYNKKKDELAKELIDIIEKNGMTIHNTLVGEIKGNPIKDWATILIAKGYAVDIENNLLGPINHSINDGYDPIEFYQGAAEARRGFYYRSTAVADPGYLARKIAMANAMVKIDGDDCKTKKYYEFIVGKQHTGILNNRYYMDGNKLEKITDVKPLIGKTIKLRSPIFCKSPNGICKICYGDSYTKTSNIGILASGAVNDVAVNAFMKMRHQASQVKLVDVDFIDLVKNSNLNKALVGLFLDVDKNSIKAKQDVKIIIDDKDYNEKTLVDNGSYYHLPGIFDIICGEEPKTELISLPFAFKVHLFKPENISNNGSIITMEYSSGETIIDQKSYIDEIDPSIITKLFEGGAKYINDPITLVTVLNQKVPEIELNHLETIVQNMFRCKDDNTVLCRLSNNYDNSIIIGQKKLPFVNSWLNSMAFENMNKAISMGLLNNKDIQFDPFEKLILEKFERSEE